MTIIVDTAPLVALADRRHSLQPVIDALLELEPGLVVLSTHVAAEADYMLRERLGRTACTSFLTDIVAGRFQVACLESAEYELALQYDRQYADLDVGLTDLSVVILAHRYGTRRILTFDRRHFRVLRPMDGGAFTLLPADLI